MKSQKLTMLVKDKIMSLIMAHKFSDEYYTEIREEYAKLANDIYEDHYKNDLVKMNGLPAGWLEESNSFRVALAGRVVYMSFSDDNSNLKGQYNVSGRKLINKRFLSGSERNAAIAVYDANHKFSEEYARLENKKNKINSEYSSTLASVKAILNSANTTTQLISVWPEIKPFVEDVLGTSNGGDRSVPVVQIEKINKILDLPIDKKA